MNLLDSLLDAIVRLNGDALVMHVGEKPYVVTTAEGLDEFRGPLAWGQVELSSRVLTAEAVAGMLGQILPLDQRSALDEIGATEYEVQAAHNPLEHFTIVAARGGDDVWLEVRRRPNPKPEPALAPAAETPQPEVVASASLAATDAPIAIEQPAHLEAAQPELIAEESQLSPVEKREPIADDPVFPEEVQEIEPPPLAAEADVEMMLIAATQDWGDDVMTEGDLGELLRASAAAVITSDPDERDSLEWSDDDEGEVIEFDAVSSPMLIAREEEPPAVYDVTEPSAELPAVPIATAPSTASDDMRLDDEAARSEPFEVAAETVPEAPAIADVSAPEPEPEVSAPVAALPMPFIEELASIEEAQEPVHPPVEAPVAVEEPVVSIAASDVEPQPVARAPEAVEEEPQEVPQEPEREVATSRPPAIVVPLPRQPKPDVAAGARASAGTTLQRLLRLAAGHGAAAVYVVAQTPPMIRVDGEFSALDGEPVMSSAFVERLLSEVLPASRDSASTSADWLIDVPEIGRVRCTTFRDHRGPGVIFRMVPARAISADQLGLSAEVQALCTEADGLVLVTGARGSGKSMLLTSFVDLINRTRSDHIITTESQIEFVHENKRSFVSQREIRGDGDTFVAAVRAACREEPDVLIIEDMRTPEVVTLALEAAETGRLVFASAPGLSIASALERIIEMFPAERREKLQTSLAGTLRGVVSQVLLRKLRGGRIAAREVLINTAAVASLILEGKTFQLPAAIENGRRAGMMSFAESLAALVREGVVHPSHAYRKAPNREQFLAILRREGVDMSVTERLA